MAKKEKTSFVCTECGYDSPKWSGKCPSCGVWSSLKEFREARPGKTGIGTEYERTSPEFLKDIKTSAVSRTASGINELDRVLGGGCLNGMTVLIGGDPGIGKSTLMLKFASKMAEKGMEPLYISGEESAEQIKDRAERIGANAGSLRIYCENSLTEIVSTIRSLSPGLVILDSIQTVFNPADESYPGAAGQLRAVASELIMLAKKSTFCLFLIGHVTKDGMIAGPKMIEHMVDAVLYFEGDRYHRFRMIRTVKNRFGSANEIGMFEMGADGLEEVNNPSQYFLDPATMNNYGASVTASMEGTRPLLLEIQALVTPSAFGTPQRNCVGYDIKRLGKIIAVLDRILGFHISSSDIFLNITGGVRLSDPGADMSVAVSLISSFSNMIVPPKSVFCGEVGLSGEIRAVSGIENRINECLKLGFEKIFVPKANMQSSKKYDKKIVFVSGMNELISLIV